MDDTPLVMYIVVGLISVAFWWQIFSKAGYSGALSLLMFVPVINIGMFMYLAISDWPVNAQPSAMRFRPGPTEDNPSDRHPCIFCGEAILAAASLCRYCKSDLPDDWVNLKKVPCPSCGIEIIESAHQCNSCSCSFPENWSKFGSIPCPKCAESIPTFIEACPHCSSITEPTTDLPYIKASGHPGTVADSNETEDVDGSPPTWAWGFLVFIIVFIGALLLIVYATR